MASCNGLLLRYMLLMLWWCIFNSIHMGKYVAGPKQSFRLSMLPLKEQPKLVITVDGTSYDCEISGELRNITGFRAKISTSRLFTVIDDYTIEEVVHSHATGTYFFHETKHRISEIAVIVNDAPRSRYEWEVLNNTQQFVNALFPTANPFINYWAPVHTGLCKKTKHYKSWGISRAKQHGIAMVHSEVWKDFHNRPIELLNVSAHATHYNPNYGEDVILIFEADNICLLEDGCGDAILYDIAHMTSELLFLGWCFPYNYPTDYLVAPLCLHAYVLTRTAARTFAGNVDTCDIAIDEQIRRFCYETEFSWSNATYRIEETFNVTQGSAFQGIITQNRTRWVH